jgi:hypothetical protein
VTRRNILAPGGALASGHSGGTAPESPSAQADLLTGVPPLSSPAILPHRVGGAVSPEMTLLTRAHPAEDSGSAAASSRSGISPIRNKPMPQRNRLTGSFRSIPVTSANRPSR